MTYYRRKSAYSCMRRGQALLVCLAIVLILLILIAATQMMVARQLALSRTQRDYDRALMMAEAGVNAYLNMLNNDRLNVSPPYPVPPYPAPAYHDYMQDPIGGVPTLAQFKTGVNNGTYPIIRYPAGSEEGYFAGQVGTGAPNLAARGTFVQIAGFGWSHGVVRRVLISAPVPSPWAIYTMDRTSHWVGSSTTINGDVGTNNKLDFNGHPAVNGTISFNGPKAGWLNGADPGGYTEVVTPNAILFPTVDQVANKLWPAATYPPGGLRYLATHNDNARAVPPISANSINASVTLVGPGDYYVTNVVLNGQNAITFDNTNGSVRLWIGPSGQPGVCIFQGGTAVVKMSQDPSKACYIYSATTTGINFAGNEEIDAAIYCYNQQFAPDETQLNSVSFSGSPTVYGQILANNVNINGNITVTPTYNLILPSNAAYKFVAPWQETSP